MKKSLIILLISIIISFFIIFLGNKNIFFTKNINKEKTLPQLENSKAPEVIFKAIKGQVPGEKCEGDSNLVEINSKEIFKNKKIVLFALPGAFTPTCSSEHLPEYEKKYQDFKNLGIDNIYALSVNDPYVMNAWFKSLNIEKIKMLPDGNAEFTEKIGMLVDKSNIGFGKRSWRYSMYIENGEIKKVFAEKNFKDNSNSDPFELSDPQTMLNYLESLKNKKTKNIK